MKYKNINMVNNEFTLPDGFDWSHRMPIPHLDSYFVRSEIIRNVRQCYVGTFFKPMLIAFEGISAN